MSRTVLNLTIDLCAGCLFLAMIATGYILRFPLPAGTNKALTLFGLTRHAWGTVHFWTSIGLLAVLLVHIVLHWQWIVTVIGRRFRLASTTQWSRLRSGLVVALSLSAAFALFAWIVHHSVKPIVQQSSDERAQATDPPSEGRNQETEGVEGQPQFDFATDIYPLLERRCLSCHGPSRQAGGFRIDRRDDLFDTSGARALVVPGNSAESFLIEIISGRQKSQRFARIHKELPEDEVTLLRAWIDAGGDWPATLGH